MALKKIKNGLSKFWKWIKSSPKNIIIILLIILLGIISIKYFIVQKKYEEERVQFSNELTDYKNKNDEMYKQSQTYITDIKTLKKKNSELYEEIKNLKDNPIVITKIRTETVYKNIYMTDTITMIVDTEHPNRFTSEMKYDDKWCTIRGVSEYDLDSMKSKYKIDSISFPNEYTLDLIESKKGDLSFIVKSNNPYCQINSIDGVMLSPEDSKSIRKRMDKKWGLFVGIGAGATYDIKNKNVAFGPCATISLSYKIFGF